MAADALARETHDASPPTLVGTAGLVLEAYHDGVIWWPDEKLLVVADLHLEKGSALAKRGQLVPPYDTRSTLARLAVAIDRLRPHVVIALGDSFHDPGGARRLDRVDAAALAALQFARSWIWIAGNHDPLGTSDLPGDHLGELVLGPVVFRHEPSQGPARGEIAGHLHPVARVYGKGRSVRRRCFAGDGHRLVLPAFGAYTGGLDVRHEAFAGLFDPATFRAFVLGEGRVYAVGSRALRMAHGKRQCDEPG